MPTPEGPHLTHPDFRRREACRETDKAAKETRVAPSLAKDALLNSSLVPTSPGSSRDPSVQILPDRLLFPGPPPLSALGVGYAVHRLGKDYSAGARKLLAAGDKKRQDGGTAREYSHGGR